jgi:hypothetical protein
MSRITNSLSSSLACLILAGAPTAAETKTAQECYKQDSNWTVSCGALEGPQKVRDDCFSMANRLLERCLDAASTGKIEPAKPNVPATRAPKRAPTGGISGAP